MKDNVIILNDKIKCYVNDELTYKDKKYIFCIELDENESLINEAVHVLEVSVKKNELITKPIEDFEIASVVNNLFLARLKMENS